MVQSSFTVAALLSLATSVVGASLPTVNLGYERHQAIAFNSTGGYYNFSNIRYAEPPVGKLRFNAPVAVTGRSSQVNDGSVEKICPQASPAWEAIAAQFIPKFLTGQPFNATAAEAALAASVANLTVSGQLPPIDPRTSEDCLFLDVMVPDKIFNARNENEDDDKAGGAPVMVWIYGGGYTSGSKTGSGDPAGLIKASQVHGDPGVIYVALNYRLGALGWLAGPTLQSSSLPAQPALYDQRLALEWVQKNIHLFGGDKSRVTVFGESAGGGSIMHQITAFGGLKGPAPFTQAILQSPGWQLIPSSYQQEQIFQAWLKLLGVSSITQAQTLDSTTVIKANLLQVLLSPYGLFTYGPVVDGLFAPALPGRLLAQGSFDKNLKIMVGHNADEGLLFTNPAITTDAAFRAYIHSTFPDISPAVFTYITTVLYPPVFDGSYGYTNEIQRTVVTVSESTFTCNTNYLDRAFLNKTYAYQFSVGPALHGQDIAYTYYNGPNKAQVVNDTIAIALQEYLTSFAIKGMPSGPGIPTFPLYGEGAMETNLNATTISEMRDPTANARCAWWQKALYY